MRDIVVFSGSAHRELAAHICAELAVPLEPFELIRVFGSRRSEAQLRALPWEGDRDRYLEARSHLPLPQPKAAMAKPPLARAPWSCSLRRWPCSSSPERSRRGSSSRTSPSSCSRVSSVTR